MRGGGDRQELGESLHDAQDDRLQQFMYSARPIVLQGVAWPTVRASSHLLRRCVEPNGETDSVVTPAAANSAIRSAMRSGGPSSEVASTNSAGTAAAAPS